MLGRIVTTDDKFTLLDIGAASGDTARLLRQLYPSASVTSLDYNSVNLEKAPPSKLIANAFELPFLPGSFDYVLCSLFLHHFSDEQVVALLQSFYHVAKRALLVCDLERHVLSYYFLPMTRWLFKWQRITLHDGPASVRAAFRSDELLTLADKAVIRDARVSVHRPAFRLSLIARKNQECKDAGGHSEEDAHRRRSGALASDAPNCWLHYRTIEPSERLQDSTLRFQSQCSMRSEQARQ